MRNEWWVAGALLLLSGGLRLGGAGSANASAARAVNVRTLPGGHVFNYATEAWQSVPEGGVIRMADGTLLRRQGAGWVPYA